MIQWTTMCCNQCAALISSKSLASLFWYFRWSDAYKISNFNRLCKVIASHALQDFQEIVRWHSRPLANRLLVRPPLERSFRGTGKRSSIAYAHLSLAIKGLLSSSMQPSSQEPYYSQSPFQAKKSRQVNDAVQQCSAVSALVDYIHHCRLEIVGWRYFPYSPAVAAHVTDLTRYSIAPV